MNLKHLTDISLRHETRKAALREREATTVLLHHIREVDDRKLYCDWRFTSLFDWCVRDLGLCEGSAQLRITAARLLADIPEIEEKIKQGTLTLTNIAQINQFCRQNNIVDINEKREMLFKVENLSKKEAEKKLFQISGKENIEKETEKRISDKKTKIVLILSDETMDSLKEIKDLIGKELSSDELIQAMVSALKEKIEKTKFKQTSKPHAAKVLKDRIIVAESRVICSAVKREVYQRDKKCTNCGSKRNLNFDHRHPYSMGGGNSAENIRLLCFQCNQRAWRTSSG